MRKITYTTAVHNKVPSSQSIKKISHGLQSEPIFKHILPHLNFLMFSFQFCLISILLKKHNTKLF